MRYLLVLLTGCTSLVQMDLNNPPPSDWPKLEEKIAYVAVSDLPKFCGAKKDPRHAEGCSVVNFRYETCYIYLANKDPALLEHERLHCKGYDHVDQPNRSRNAWEKWKASSR